jgi:hypothetical protein
MPADVLDRLVTLSLGGFKLITPTAASSREGDGLNYLTYNDRDRSRQAIRGLQKQNTPTPALSKEGAGLMTALALPQGHFLSITNVEADVLWGHPFIAPLKLLSVNLNYLEQSLTSKETFVYCPSRGCCG